MQGKGEKPLRELMRDAARVGRKRLGHLFEERVERRRPIERRGCVTRAGGAGAGRSQRDSRNCVRNVERIDGRDCGAQPRVFSCRSHMYRITWDAEMEAVVDISRVYLRVAFTCINAHNALVAYQCNRVDSEIIV